MNTQNNNPSKVVNFFEKVMSSNPSPTIKEGEQQEKTVEQAFDKYCSNMGYLQTTRLRNLFEYAANWQKNQQPKGEQGEAEAQHLSIRNGIATETANQLADFFFLHKDERTAVINALVNAFMVGRKHATPSMETKERGEQESDEAIVKLIHLCTARFKSGEYDMADCVLRGYQLATTTLQAEIEELKAERERLESMLVKAANLGQDFGAGTADTLKYDTIEHMIKAEFINPSKP